MHIEHMPWILEEITHEFCVLPPSISMSAAVELSCELKNILKPLLGQKGLKPQGTHRYYKTCYFLPLMQVNGNNNNNDN